MVDEHGAAGCDGFVDGGSAGFSDGEVVGGEEFWDVAGPAFDLDTAGEFFLDFACAIVEFSDVSAEDDGDGGLCSGDGKDGAEVFADSGFFGGGEVEDFEWGAGFLGGEGNEFFEARVDGESGDDDFLFGEALLDEGFFGVGVGDEPVVCGGVFPGGVYFDGVGDDSEYGDFFCSAAE